MQSRHNRTSALRAPSEGGMSALSPLLLSDSTLSTKTPRFPVYLCLSVLALSRYALSILGREQRSKHASLAGGSAKGGKASSSPQKTSRGVC